MSTIQLTRLFSKQINTVGLVIGQHSLAEGVLAGLTGLGVRIPEELSVVIIGEPTWASFLPWTFTTIERPLERIGEMAARLLLNRTSNKLTEDRKSTRLNSSHVRTSYAVSC